MIRLPSASDTRALAVQLYCIRHTYGLWDANTPAALMTDAEAVGQLVNHRYFKPHKTPLQIFNRSTDPFLAGVRDHLFAVLEDLDSRGLTNHVLVITRAVVRDTDCARLNALKNLKLTLLFTYSGIEDRRVEPYPSSVAAASLRRATAYSSAEEPRRYRTILYWRPLVPGLNDTDDHLQQGPGIVVFQQVRSKLRMVLGSRAWCRRRWAMFSTPVSRRRLMAVLRRVAMTCGPLPVRTWERSSS